MRELCPEELNAIDGAGAKGAAAGAWVGGVIGVAVAGIASASTAGIGTVAAAGIIASAAAAGAELGSLIQDAINSGDNNKTR